VTTEQLGKGLTRVLLHYGFMELPKVPEALAPVLAELEVSAESLVYIVGRETMVVTERGRMGRLTEPVEGPV